MKAPRATTQQTIEALLQASKRNLLPLSYRFVQHRDEEDKGVAGPLAEFVKAHNFRGLHQYLLAHAAASGGKFEVTRDSRIWARALGLDETKPSSRAAVSKGWSWLEQRKLIRRERRGRLAKITLCSDDGSGRPYQHPYDEGQPYFTLPYDFWRQRWHQRLDLSATAVLLIGMSLGPRFILPQSHVQEWYGISPATLSKGIASLRKADLLTVKRDAEVAPLAPMGFRYVYRYTVLAPFHRPAPSNKKLGEAQ
jgi:DNA-binding transcriptional ArsR family regulator